MAFRGHFEHSLDAKNRLSIPARFRASFSAGTVLAKDPEAWAAFRSTYLDLPDEAAYQAAVSKRAAA